MSNKVDYKIRRGMSGFRISVNYYYLSAMLLINEHETQTDEYGLNKAEDYVQSLRFMELYKIFEEKLTQDQKEAMDYFSHHNPDEKEPLCYEVNLECAYQKWLHTFFDHKARPRLYKRLNPRFLGRTMKRTRLSRHTKIAELGDMIGAIPKTIERYEKGEVIPSLEYLVLFCQIFKIDFSFIINNSLF